MFKYLLLCTLTAQAIWCAPAVLGDIASHIVIVTPQAQVHLDPAGGPFIQHLTPFARFSAPHEETIVYVPASVASPILHTAAEVGRSSGTPEQLPLKSETKQIEQISTQIQQAIQQGSSMFGPQLSEAAAAAAAAASSAGSGFFPAFFPPPNSNKDEQLKSERIEYETPASTKPLQAATAEARRYYALSPVVPHIVDIVHAPIFLSAIRARSLQVAGKPAEPSLIAALPLPEAAKPEALPLKEELKTELPKETVAVAAELEKKTDFGRFLEANALKEQIKPQQQLEELDLKKDNLKPELEFSAVLPQNLAIASDLALAQPISDGAAANAVPLKAVANDDELPKSKEA